MAGDSESGRTPLYVRVERSLEDLLVRGRYKVGDRLPPEMRLVEELGVSRATVRAGLSRLEGRGLVERRQGSGTFLARVPEGARLRNGMERLETYTVQAARLGLTLGSRDVRIESTGADGEEAVALGVRRGAAVTRMVRVLLVDGEAAAWMLDVVPEGVLGGGIIREKFRPEEMLLDVLISSGVPVGFSELEIDVGIITPEDETGKCFGLEKMTAALSLTEKIYLENGDPAQFSRNIFLPGALDLHVLREYSGERRLK